MGLRRDPHRAQVQYQLPVQVDLRLLKLDGVRWPYPKLRDYPKRPYDNRHVRTGAIADRFTFRHSLTYYAIHGYSVKR